MLFSKRIWRRGCLFGLAVALLAGAEVWRYRVMTVKVIPAEVLAVLENAEEFEFLSMDPHMYENPNGTELHGFRILGNMKITDAEQREALVQSLKKAVDDHRHNYRLACLLQPRHAIRAKHGAVTMDVLICFECEMAEVFRNGERHSGFLLTASEKGFFNGVLTDAGINITPDEKEWEADMFPRGRSDY